MIIRPKDGRGCDCNPLDSIIMRLEELERRAQFIVARVQGIAPDGEGNVTLPTSESIDGPLFGSIQAFSMSSEVKGAYDDLHAYASAIADDIIEVRSDIVDLDRRIDELEPEGVDALQNAVDALSMAVDSLRADKVNKAGDTMTGELKMSNGALLMEGKWNDIYFKHPGFDTDNPPTNNWLFKKIKFMDKNDNRVGELVCNINVDGSHDMFLRTWFENSTKFSNGYANFGITRHPDGTAYGTAPSWSVRTNDNSDKILTIKMANSLPSLVHSTGNETISGNKTFTGNPTLSLGYPVIFTKNIQTPDKAPPTETRYGGFVFRDVGGTERGGVQVCATPTGGAVLITCKTSDASSTAYLTLYAKDDGTKFAICPTTPTDATSNEIATANWVLDKINAFAAANGLTGV